MPQVKTHCWHLPDVMATTWQRGEPREYRCCFCGKHVVVTGTLKPSKHGQYAPESARGVLEYKLPDEECPQHQGKP